MPTDTAERTVVVAAPYTQVLATIRDVASQVDWIPEIRSVEVLESDARGRPLRARLKASATVGTDEYTLAYEYPAHGLSWTMLEGKLQTGQEGRFALAKGGPTHTEVSYRLTIHHNLPLPGFVRRRVIQGLVDDTLGGLQQRFAGRAA
ncbi:MAG TPA: SRPBCC family protein [Marmoricola sp.]|nr:SRPBCC family protein [Marmoricola sp.]